MDKQKLNSIYGLHLEKDDLVCTGDSFDSTTAFLSGAILGYCQSHKPEEVAELFNDAFNILSYDKACSIVACISGKMIIICSAKEDV